MKLTKIKVSAALASVFFLPGGEHKPVYCSCDNICVISSSPPIITAQQTQLNRRHICRDQFSSLALFHTAYGWSATARARGGHLCSYADPGATQAVAVGDLHPPEHRVWEGVRLAQLGPFYMTVHSGF